jgi:hypothetical protein
MPCTKVAGVTIGISRYGLSASRSASPLTTKRAWQVRVAADGQFQKFVVGRIAARGDPLGDGDQLGGSHQFLQPFPRVGIDQRVKVGTGDDLE